MDTSGGVLSIRKQKSAARLLEFQRRRRIRLLWRRVLQKFVHAWRHERVWRVHNAWFAALPASADTAGPPAPEAERMDEDSGTTRAANPAGQGVEGSASPPPMHAGGPSPSGLNPAALEFSPGLAHAAVESAWFEAATRWFGERVDAYELADITCELDHLRKAAGGASGSGGDAAS